MDVKLALTHFDFHLTTIFITLRPNRDIPPSPFHIPTVLKLAPVLSLKKRFSWAAKGDFMWEA